MSLPRGRSRGAPLCPPPPRPGRHRRSPSIPLRPSTYCCYCRCCGPGPRGAPARARAAAPASPRLPSRSARRLPGPSGASSRPARLRPGTARPGPASSPRCPGGHRAGLCFGIGIRARVRVHRILQRKYSRSPLCGDTGAAWGGGFVFRSYICLGPGMLLSESHAVEKVA